MSEELADIVDAIVAMQKNDIPLPAGQTKGIALATDEPMEDVSVFPAFLNIEEAIDVTHGPSRRQDVHTINMHLLFARADQKYSVRARRAWILQVRNTFDLNLRLFLRDTGVAQCHYARVSRVEYHDNMPFNTPLALGDHEYIAATFILEVLVDGAFAYSSGS